MEGGGRWKDWGVACRAASGPAGMLGEKTRRGARRPASGVWSCRTSCSAAGLGRRLPPPLLRCSPLFRSSALRTAKHSIFPVSRSRITTSSMGCFIIAGTSAAGTPTRKGIGAER